MASLLLGALLLANIAAFGLEEERSRLDLRYQPPHPGLLQRILWDGEVRDVILMSGPFGFGGAEQDTSLFATAPPATAVVGQPYRYRPRVTVPLTDFRLAQAPAGLEVDPATGEISGRPAATAEGRHEVVLEGSLASGDRVQHRFPLFVDTRFLLLGSDERGKDVARQLLLAARYTLLPGLIAVLIGVGGGLLLGALAGFYPGPLRAAISALGQGIEAVPALLLLFLVAAISGFDLFIVMVVVGLILLPETARGVAERVESFRRRDFVEAARELGLRDRTILWNEIVWHNLRPLLLARTAQGFIYAILAEITLSYMGLGVQEGASLGRMLLQGRTAVAGAGEQVPWLVLAPLAGIMGVIAVFALLEKALLTRTERAR